MTLPVKVTERDLEHERLIGVVFNLPPSQACVLSCLLRNTVVSTEELSDYVGNKSHIRIAVSRARLRLEESGFSIHSQNRAGYWLEPSDREGIERSLREFLGG